MLQPLDPVPTDGPTVYSAKPGFLLLPRLVATHLPTGNVYDRLWTGHQHWMLGEPEFHAPRTILKICEELVAKWNRQQPDTWHYVIL